MAVVNKYMQEEQQRINNQKANQGNAYSKYNISPISAATRQQMSQPIQQAAQYTAGQQPQSYVSRYQPVLESIMAQIQNPEEFRYEFNGDELFKNYADLYTQYGKQASLDAMGQAAGLTGGYGNSYGQQVGQQTNQQYLLPLYDKGLEMQNAAYTKYQNDLANLKDAYNMMQAAETADYGRYSDAVAAWQNQQQLDEQKRMNDFDMAYKQDEFKYRWGLNQPAAAESSGGGGGSSSGGGSKTYTAVNGNYYQKNDNGTYTKVDKSQVKATDKVDTSKDYINKGDYYKLRKH